MSTTTDMHFSIISFNALHKRSLTSLVIPDDEYEDTLLTFMKNFWQDGILNHRPSIYYCHKLSDFDHISSYLTPHQKDGSKYYPMTETIIKPCLGLNLNALKPQFSIKNLNQFVETLTQLIHTPIEVSHQQKGISIILIMPKSTQETPFYSPKLHKQIAPFYTISPTLLA